MKHQQAQEITNYKLITLTVVKFILLRFDQTIDFNSLLYGYIMYMVTHIYHSNSNHIYHFYTCVPFSFFIRTYKYIYIGIIRINNSSSRSSCGSSNSTIIIFTIYFSSLGLARFGLMILILLV